MIEDVKTIAWPLYTLLGALLVIINGWILSFIPTFRTH